MSYSLFVLKIQMYKLCSYCSYSHYVIALCFSVKNNILMPCFQIKHKSTQRQVDIKIRKQEERWWDRLTLQEKKPLFLAPDFDRWLDESDAEMELQAKVGT